jgi:aminomethyltransferase
MTTVLHNLAATGEQGEAQAEFRALVSGCGVYEPASRVRIALTGKDRVRWLNGMVTNNIRDLAAGRGVYAFLLNPQGHILGDLYAYNRGESLLLDIDGAQAEKVLGTLRRYIIMDKVELAEVSGQLSALGICGAKAQEVLRDAGFELRGSELPGFELAELAPLQFVDLIWREAPVTVMRGDNPGVAAFELWLAPEQIEAARQELVKAGAAIVGMGALELLRVASGIPRYGQDIRERDLPQETEQARALNFSKGCYIGQEIVERIRSRGAVHRRFTGFLVDGALPPVETKIQCEGKDVGEITSTASLPWGDGLHHVALGYLLKEAAQPGKMLLAAGAKLRVAAIPFEEVFKN